MQAAATQQPTGKAVADFKARVRVGTVLRCLENTYSASHGFDRAGKLATITRAGNSTCNATMDDKSYHLSWPQRVSDVVALTADTITYRVGRDDHTVTWQIVTDHEHCGGQACWQNRVPCPLA